MLLSNFLIAEARYMWLQKGNILKTEIKKQEIIIRIKDGGKGIDSEIMPKLFRKFATKSETGTGLGLYICKSIIEFHNGRIWAENNADGNGATFTFSLPISRQQYQQQEQEPRLPSSKWT